MSISAVGQSAELPGVNEVRPEDPDLPSPVLPDVLSRRKSAFQAFFRRRIKTGETPGYPRLQGATRYNRFPSQQLGHGATLDHGFLVLSTIGRSAVRWSRPRVGTPKTVTVAREAHGWSVGCSGAEGPMPPLPPCGQETGMDLGVEACATRAHGTRLFPPGGYRQADRGLKTAHPRVSRRQTGSNRRRTAVVLLATAHLKGKRQRQDVHHPVALQLVQTTDTIAPEDVPTPKRLKTPHLAKRLSDAGGSGFLSLLAAKAASAGRRVVAVPPASTSQTGSGCGVLVAKGWSVRWPTGPDCGTSLHRDPTAAKNRERLGHRLGGAVASAAAQNREAPGFSRGSVKPIAEHMSRS